MKGCPHTDWVPVTSLEHHWQIFVPRQPDAEALLELATLPITAPRTLGIGLGYGCNFSCPLCYYAQQRNQFGTQHTLATQQLDNILQPFKKLRSVILGMEGEPLFLPNFWQAMESVTKVASGIMLASNASLVTIDSARRLREFPVDAMALSIDAGEHSTYARLRRGGDFDIFCANARRLVDALGERVFLHAVLLQQNSASLLRLPALARNLGISRVSIAQLRMTPQVRLHGLCPCDFKELRKFWVKFLTATDNAQIEIVMDDMFADTQMLHYIWTTSEGRYGNPSGQTWGCAHVWQYAGLTSCLEFIPCCGSFWPHKIATAHINPEDIYNNRYIKILRVLTIAGAYPEVCERSCFRQWQQPPAVAVIVQRLREMQDVVRKL